MIDDEHWARLIRHAPKGSDSDGLKACGCDYCYYAMAWNLISNETKISFRRDGHGFFKLDEIDNLLYPLLPIEPDHWLFGPHAKTLVKALLIKKRFNCE